MTVKNPFKTALIDGDAVVMAAGYGSEKSVKGELISLDPVSYALHKVKLIMEKIKVDVPAETYEIFIGDKDTKNFR